MKMTRDAFKIGPKPSHHRVQEAFWRCLGRGLIYIDFVQSHPHNWDVYLSSPGKEVAKDAEGSPNHPSAYLALLRQVTPQVSDVTTQYATEAVNSYTSQNYLASAVMIGAATEGAVLELMSSFAQWLQGSEREALRTVLDSQRNKYWFKFKEFRKRLEVHKPELPTEYQDNLSINLDFIVDVIRLTRNEAGHPKGATLARHQVHDLLLLFRGMIPRIYGMKSFFESV